MQDLLARILPVKTRADPSLQMLMSDGCLYYKMYTLIQAEKVKYREQRKWNLND